MTPSPPNTTNLISLYAQEQAELWQRFPVAEVAAAYALVQHAYENGGTVFGCANGGGAGVVANLLNDFATVPFLSDDKHTVAVETHKRLRVVNLSESPVAITAVMNDLGPEMIFREQLLNQGVKAGDVLFVLSGSGNSGNIVSALELASDVGAQTVGVTRGPGSKVMTMCDVGILIEGTSQFPGQVGGNNFNFHFEEASSAIGHMITGLLKQYVQAGTKAHA